MPWDQVRLPPAPCHWYRVYTWHIISAHSVWLQRILFLIKVMHTTVGNFGKNNNGWKNNNKWRMNEIFNPQINRIIHCLINYQPIHLDVKIIWYRVRTANSLLLQAIRDLGGGRGSCVHGVWGGTQALRLCADYTFLWENRPEGDSLPLPVQWEVTLRGGGGVWAGGHTWGARVYMCSDKALKRVRNC